MDVLFSYCRYYKGEKKNPFPDYDVRALLWDYERNWCEIQRNKDDFMHDIVCEYNVNGLDDFEPYDGVPVSLKAFLFNRYCHWNSGSPYDCIEPFKKWYNDTYKKAGQ